MLSRVESLKDYVKYVRHPTEGFLFYLQYRVTFLSLIFACIIITPKLLLWTPITCTPPEPPGEITKELMDSYCYTHSTYTIGEAYKKQPGKDVPHPGIDISDNEADFIYHDYYQYIHYILFIQALLFYIPHGLWKYIENKQFTKLMKKLQNLKIVYNSEITLEMEEEEEKSQEYQQAAAYLLKVWGSYSRYAYKYILCEVLAFINIVLQIWLLDIFFNGQFVLLGLPKYQSMSYRELMNRVFPRVTRCHFNKFGSAGVVDTVDVLCVLVINALNEKIYYIIWFWYVFLLIMNVINFSWQLVTLIFPSFRIFRLLSSVKLFRLWQFYNMSDMDDLISKVIKYGNYGDWFVISSIKATMYRYDFYCIIQPIYHEISKWKQKTEEIPVTEIEPSEDIINE